MAATWKSMLRCGILLVLPCLHIAVVDRFMGDARLCIPHGIYVALYVFLCRAKKNRNDYYHLIPSMIMILLAFLYTKIPMDYREIATNGYMEGSRKGLGALRWNPKESILVHFFVLDDRITLYGFLSEVYAGVLAGRILAGLAGRNKSSCGFSMQKAMISLLLTLAVFAFDGFSAWASILIRTNNWFGDARNNIPERMQLYHQLQLLSAIAMPAGAFLLGKGSGVENACKKGMYILTALFSLLEVVLVTGMFIVPVYINPFTSVASGYLPSVASLLPLGIQNVFVYSVWPEYVGVMIPLRLLGGFYLGTLRRVDE